MNRLAIAKEINNNAGTQGTVDTTTNTSGYQAVLIAFMDQAYNDILIAREDWKFMKLTVFPMITEAAPTYVSTDIAEVDRVIYNKRELKEIDYDDWWLKDHQTGQPVEYTVDPVTLEVLFNPLDGDYSVTLQYFRVPPIMAGNLDTPIIPIRFHSTISYKALIDLGSYLGNDDLITKYTLKYDVIIGQLMRSQIKGKTLKTLPLV